MTNPLVPIITDDGDVQFVTTDKCKEWLSERIEEMKQDSRPESHYLLEKIRDRYEQKLDNLEKKWGQE